MKKKNIALFAISLLMCMGTTVFAHTVPHSSKKTLKYADVQGRDNYLPTATSEAYWTGPSTRSLTTIQITNYANQVKATGGVHSEKLMDVATWNVNNKTTTHYHITVDHLE